MRLFVHNARHLSSVRLGSSTLVWQDHLDELFIEFASSLTLPYNMGIERKTGSLLQVEVYSSRQVQKYFGIEAPRHGQAEAAMCMS